MAGLVSRRGRRRRNAAPLSIRVAREDGETEVRDRLLSLVAIRVVRVSGRDCRALQLLVKIAACEGLEIRDRRGCIVRATDQLMKAKGVEPDRKRHPLRWTVQVLRPTMQVPNRFDYVMRYTGPDGLGRVLVFAPGTPMLLWDGECL